MATSNLRFGPGVTREVGMDLADMQVLLVTDATMKDLPPVEKVRESLDEKGDKSNYRRQPCAKTLRTHRR